MQSLTTRPAYWLTAIVIAFIGLSFISSYNLPLFAGFDETAHYRTVDYYARHATLPDLNRAPSHEAHQPPLYYSIGALLIAPIERDDIDAVLQSTMAPPDNPRWNKTPLDILRTTGSVQALLILRLFSILLGAITVGLAYMLARRLLLTTPFSLLGAALLAFNPKFLMLSASVSNDIAALCAAAWCLVLCAWYMNHEPSLRGAFALGASVGLAALCKTSGLGLGLPVVFAIVWSAATQSRYRKLARYIVTRGMAAALGGLLIAGWLYVIQWSHYGSPLAWEQVILLNRFSMRAVPLDVGQYLAMLPPMLPTLWRINPDLPLRFVGDAIAAAVLLVAIAGWMIGIARREIPAVMSLLPVAMAGSLIALVPWMRLYGGTEDSRLLPTVFASMAILGAAGIAVVVSKLRTRGPWLIPIVAGVSLVWAGIAPSILLAPESPQPRPDANQTYIPQLSMAERDLLPLTPVAQFENGIELAQVAIAPLRISSGDIVSVTMAWRVTRPVLLPSMLTLEAFDTNGRSLAKLDTRPLDGHKSTALWQVGDVYRETYGLSIATVTGDAPLLADIYAGWHGAEPPYAVSGLVGSQRLSALIGRVKVRASSVPAAAPNVVGASYGGVISLDGYNLQGNSLTLHWRAIGRLPLDYQVFVHVLDAKGKSVGQADGPLPLAAVLWDSGETILDRRQVSVPIDGSILVGVYDLATGARLPAVHADGSRWVDDSAILKP
ncbi:MAG TPA: glycosyltransferase family 39 protein [Anaerolineae bacterium]|jgi:4-amino-4-deoxy-L-arabinose transferase-like glycosyltransferase